MIDAKTVEELRGLLAADTSTDWQTVRSDPAEGADVWWICAKNAAGQEVELGSLQGGWPHPTREARARLIVAMRNALPDLLDLATASLAREGEGATDQPKGGDANAKAADETINRLRAENTDLIHREKVRREAINKSMNDANERADREQDRANLAFKLFDQREEYLASLNAINTELREALKPFARRADRYDPEGGDDEEPDWSTAAPSIHIGDLRRARTALEGRKDG